MSSRTLPRVRQDRPAIDPAVRSSAPVSSSPLSGTRLVVGSLFLVGGTIALLRVLGVIGPGFVAGWWCVGAAGLGFLQLAFGDNRYAKALGLVLFLFGSALTLSKWYPEMLQPERVWDVAIPMAALGLGGYLVLRTLVPGSGGSTSDRVSVFAFWSGSEQNIDSPHFEGGDLTAIMGGFELDLRDAEIAEGGEAVIDVLAIMGGGVIYVPEGWSVDTRVMPIMGGVSVKTKSAGAESRGRLRIRGLALMGGLEVRTKS